METTEFDVKNLESLLVKEKETGKIYLVLMCPQLKISTTYFSTGTGFEGVPKHEALEFKNKLFKSMQGNKE